MQIEADMPKLQQLYSVYEVHAKNVDSFSMVLWADLDVTKIIEVTEEVSTELKKKKHLFELPLYDVVYKNIEGFLSALPLMKELKSDALRKRHWKILMVVSYTQIYFCYPSSNLQKITTHVDAMCTSTVSWSCWCRSRAKSLIWTRRPSRWGACSLCPLTSTLMTY